MELEQSYLFWQAYMVPWQIMMWSIKNYKANKKNLIKTHKKQDQS